ncbi:hypothetical protein CKW39_08780 [Kocuria sp. WRN011]|uniref:hypothetical protein n=1 Tax=Kocuria sp. WRN011 TaxID=2029858 RepID=UPI000BAFA9F8|nr:hypothetical protein [Kocuria sp. WRN011]PBB08446.1 hypothetical protein CKW39_08780 [Kocuria sp. WRN011]
MSERMYAVVTVTDHRTDPPKEFQGLARWRDARERRCGIAGAASGAFRTQMSAGPAFEVHWGDSEWAPAQIFIGGQFAADLEIREVSAEDFGQLGRVLAGERQPADEPDEAPEPELVAEGVPFGEAMPAFYGGGQR